jgi:hypothetical protein
MANLTAKVRALLATAADGQEVQIDYRSDEPRLTLRSRTLIVADAKKKLREAMGRA